jgi:hypothetical protein
MNVKFFLILSIYTIWDGLSQKTIARYCPFKLLHRLGGIQTMALSAVGECAELN